MDIGKSFSYVFEDKKWIEKILIGGIVSLIPIVGFWLVYGYLIQLVRNVRNHEPEPLPAWDEWGDKLIEGLKLMIIYFIWGLPLFILYFLIILPLSFTGDSDSGSTIAGLFATCFGCFAFLYAIILWLATPGITIKYAEGGQFSDGFKVGEILDFTKSHLGQIVIVALVSWVVYMIAGLVGTLLCFVGLFFTLFWGMLVQYHMMAQIGLEDRKPDRPLATTPPTPTEPATPELAEPTPEPLPEPEQPPAEGDTQGDAS